MSYYNTHYIYYHGYPLNSGRIAVDTIDFRSASETSLDILSDQTSGGVSILDFKDGAKEISLGGGLTQLNGEHMTTLSRDLNYILKSRDTYLRIVPVDKTVTLYDPISTTGWTYANDGTAVALDTSIYFRPPSSLKLTVTVGNSAQDYAVFSYTGSQVDITNYDGFDIPLWFSDSYYISSVEIRIGNDSSNYYSWTVPTQSLGFDIHNEANVFSVAKADATTTGSVTQTQIDYLYIKINYSSSATSFSAYLGRVYGFIDSFTTNYTNVYNQRDISINTGQGITEGLNDTTATWSASLLCPHEYAESTFSTRQFTQTVTALQQVKSFTYNGSKSALPTTSITFDSSVSNITDFQIQSLDTGKTIEINDTSFLVGDVLAFDFEKKSVTKNGIQLYYTGLTQDFFVRGVNYLELNIGQANAGTTLNYLDIYETSRGTYSTYLAQSFTTGGSAGILTYGEVIITEPTDLFDPPTLQIWTNSAGSPSTQLSSAYANIELKSIDSYYTRYRAYGTFNQSLSASTMYWLVLVIDGASVAPFGETSSFYSGGSAKYYNGSSWVVSSLADMAFKTVVQTPPTHSLTWTLDTKKYDY